MIGAHQKRVVSHEPESMSQLPRVSVHKDKAFLVLLVAVSLAFAWILMPFYGAILWAVILATVFVPVQRWFREALPGRPNLSALLTLLVIIGIVLIPLAFTAASIVAEATALYERLQSGQLNLGRFLQRFLDALPGWASNILDRLGLNDLAHIQQRVIALLKEGSEFFATQAVLVGQGTANVLLSVSIMLYLLFFLLRDGRVLAQKILNAVPLADEHKSALFEKFAIVVRAMVKGTILVAIVQGFLGGFIFWILGIHAPVLWGVVHGLPVLAASYRGVHRLVPGCRLSAGHRRVAQRPRSDGLRRGRHRAGGQSPQALPRRKEHGAARLCGADLHARRDRHLRTERLRHRPADRGDVPCGLGYLRTVEGLRRLRPA